MPATFEEDARNDAFSEMLANAKDEPTRQAILQAMNSGVDPSSLAPLVKPVSGEALVDMAGNVGKSIYNGVKTVANIAGTAVDLALPVHNVADDMERWEKEAPGGVVNTFATEGLMSDEEYDEETAKADANQRPTNAADAVDSAIDYFEPEGFKKLMEYDRGEIGQSFNDLVARRAPQYIVESIAELPLELIMLASDEEIMDAIVYLPGYVYRMDKDMDQVRLIASALKEWAVEAIETSDAKQAYLNDMESSQGGGGGW